MIVRLFLIIIGMASAPLQFLSNREVFDIAEDALNESNGASEGFTFFSRLFNALIFLMMMIIIRKILSSSIKLTYRVKILILALGAYLFFNYVLGSLFGNYSGLPSNAYLYLSIIILIILTLIGDISSIELLATFKWIAFFMLAGSIFMGAFFPDISYVRDSFDFEFSDSRRLIGLFDHPRQLGLYALFLCAIEFKWPSQKILHWIVLFISFSALILSVSKTAIIFLSLFLIWHFYGKNYLNKVVIWGGVFVVTFYFLTLGDLFEMVGNKDNILSLTGRAGLWGLVFSSFWDHPFFGNGPYFFSGAGVTSYAHAHNILLQSVSDAGLFGLLGIIFYIFSLIKIAKKNNKFSNSLSINLVLLLLLFSMFEPVMRVDTFINGSFFINSFLILYLCAIDRERTKIMRNNF